ncbi:hypothetical protein [Gottfriedia acidiceleris]
MFGKGTSSQMKSCPKMLFWSL